MRNSNCDLKAEVEPQNPGPERRQQQPVTGGAASFAAGYTTLDQADNSPYAPKERRGLSRDANYPTRY